MSDCERATLIIVLHSSLPSCSSSPSLHFLSSPPFLGPSPLSPLMNADDCSGVPGGLFSFSSAGVIEQEGWSHFPRAVLMIKAVHMVSAG